jgi:hypothetical protein
MQVLCLYAVVVLILACLLAIAATGLCFYIPAGDMGTAFS